MAEKKAVVCAYSGHGRILQDKIEGYLRQEGFCLQRRQLDAELFAKLDALIFVGACGIAVRKVAPFLRDKWTDPAVLVVDEQGRHCISLLSGHAGGANTLCRQLSAFLEAQPVITTATDLEGLFAVDEFARENELVLTDHALAKEVSASLLRGEAVGFFSELPLEQFRAEHGYQGLTLWQAGEQTPELGIYLGNGKQSPYRRTLYIRPKNLVLGAGCKKGKTAEELGAFVKGALTEAGYDPGQIIRLCSIEHKKTEEGMQTCAKELNVPFETFSAEELKAIGGAFSESSFVEHQMGVGNVCERSAVLGSRGGRLLVKKCAGDGMTLAVAEQMPEMAYVSQNDSPALEETLRSDHGVRAAHRLYIIGIGPGKKAYRTLEAQKALEVCSCIAGYTVYADLLRGEFPDKQWFTTPMTGEKERCLWALQQASEGKKAALICSGDAGVYGMAGLTAELAVSYPEVELKVVSGVSAAFAGGALLGAPLSHDFAVVSLSDRLTPWQVIEKRLRALAGTGMPVALYNPGGKARPDTLKRACDILLEYLPEDTVCGIAEWIGREGEQAQIVTLKDLRTRPPHMFMTVLIGSSATKVVGGRMVTPRGYLL